MNVSDEVKDWLAAGTAPGEKNELQWSVECYLVRRFPGMLSDAAADQHRVYMRGPTHTALTEDAWQIDLIGGTADDRETILIAANAFASGWHRPRFPRPSGEDAS